MANVGDVTVRLQADLGNFTAGMTQAQAQTSRIGVAMDHLSAPAFGATRGLREMEFAMRTVAVQSIGATGGIGNMAAGLAQMTLGGPIMLGVLAAFAAVGLALDHVKKQTDEYTKAIEDERKAFQAHLDTINKLHPTEDNYGKLVAQLTQLQQGYNAQFGQTGDFLHDLEHGTTSATDAARQMEQVITKLSGALHDQLMGRWRAGGSDTAAQLAQQIRDATLALDAMQKTVTGDSDGAKRLRQEILAVASALSDMGAALEDERLTRWIDVIAGRETQPALAALTAKIQQLSRELAAVATGSDRWAQLRQELVEVQAEFDHLRAKVFGKDRPNLTVEGLSVFGVKAKEGMEAFARSLDPKIVDDGMKQAIERVDLTAFKKLNKSMDSAGRTAIEMLVRGMVEGTKNFGDVLKQAVLMLVEKSITSVIVKALGILSPSKVAYGWGQNIVLGLVGGLQAGHEAVRGASGRLATAAVSGSPNLHMTVNVPPPRDPFSFARDADWQRGLRESLLVAAAGGFKAA